MTTVKRRPAAASLGARRNSDLRWCVSLAAIALASHAAFFFGYFGGSVPFAWDTFTYHQFASSLLEGKGYLNSRGLPTAVNPPGYPLLLVVVYALSGRSDLMVVIVQWIFGAASAVVVYLIGRRALPPVFAGAAGLAMCWHVDMLLWHSHILSEALAVLIVVVALWLAATFQQTGRLRYLVLCGSAYGIGLLTRPILIGLFLLLAPWLGWWGRPWRRAAVTVMIFVTVVAAVLAPWAIRNRLVMGDWLVLSSKGGDAMFWSVHWTPHIGSMDALYPHEIEGMSEADANRFLLHYAWRRIRHSPWAYAKRAALKFAITWEPTYAKHSRRHNILDVAWWIVTMAGITSFATLRGWKGRRAWSSLLIGAIVAQTAMIMVTTSDDEFRYRLTILPALLLVAAAGYERLRIRLRPSPS